MVLITRGVEPVALIPNMLVSHTPPVSANPLVRLYDGVAGSIGRLGLPLEQALAGSASPAELGQAYAAAAAQPMRLMILLTANTRVLLLFLACLVERPQLFWWAEIVPLTLVTVAGLAWHRRVESRFAGAAAAFHRGDSPSSFA